MAQVARHPQRPLPWITSARCSPISRNCTAIAPCRRPLDRRRPGALQRPVGNGDRPAERARHQGKDPAQFRHAASGGLPQGDAPDAPGGKIRHPGADFRGYARRLSRHRCRGARPVRGDRPQPLCHGRLRVPIICTVIGEGGSGGALALAVGDMVMMLQYAIYSVISPRVARPSCGKRRQGARGGGNPGHHGRHRLKTLGLIDKIVPPGPEPLGDAHEAPHRRTSTHGPRAVRQCCAPESDRPVGERFFRLLVSGSFNNANQRWAGPRVRSGAGGSRPPTAAPKARVNLCVWRGRVGGVVWWSRAAGTRDRPAAAKRINVNHRISPNAYRWERFCRALCRNVGVQLTIRRVSLAARRARLRGCGARCALRSSCGGQSRLRGACPPARRPGRDGAAQPVARRRRARCGGNAGVWRAPRRSRRRGDGDASAARGVARSRHRRPKPRWRRETGDARRYPGTANATACAS